MKTSSPTVLVILGITGDLASRKIIPALFNLYKATVLPPLFAVVGFGRREWSTEDLGVYIREVMVAHKVEEGSELERFIKLFSYEQGLFEDAAGYRRLAQKLGRQDGEWKACSNKLFYLSVPPEQYQVILEHLQSSGLSVPCSDNTGWTRVLVEKPFGADAQSAEALDEKLGQLFSEEQIYRIDHYLAKEALQNILTFRFANDVFEDVWNTRHIERIDIRLWEKLGVEKRGAFYDKLGALRDVGQNHLLQMLALVCMDRPASLSASDIRRKRFEFLEKVSAPRPDELLSKTFRAQYKGYGTIDGVANGSTTETYFNVQVEATDGRWKGVPATLQFGKRMAEIRKDIVVTFRHQSPCFCPVGGPHRQNKITFELEPEEKITMSIWAKTPDKEYKVEEKDLSFLLRGNERRTQYVEEYEKLLLDAIDGDQTLFVSTDEVRAMWRVTDPIVAGWSLNLAPLAEYAPDTNEIAEIANERLVQRRVKEIGIVGLGKMGANMARRLAEQGWRVIGLNRTLTVAESLASEGVLEAAVSVEEFAKKFRLPKLIWLMVPAGQPVDDMIAELLPYLQTGDTVIDGGNSNYQDSLPRAELLAMGGISYMDVGTSGGPWGARNGACLMIGGQEKDFVRHEQLFRDFAAPGAYQFFSGNGAGHFVKMVHNGIEYGMMQAIAEGMEVLKAAKYNLDLSRVADIYNNGSVIQSRLSEWLVRALQLHGEALQDVTSTVAHTGEGQWTVDAANKLGVRAEVIRLSLEFRKLSAANPSFAGKVLSALREQFGGHAIE